MYCVYDVNIYVCIDMGSIIFHQQAAFFHGNFDVQVTVTDSSASSTKAVKAVLNVASSRGAGTVPPVPSCFSAAKFAVFFFLRSFERKNS